MCTVPMATNVADCEKDLRSGRQHRQEYMMAETVVYSREFLFIKELYQKGELGEIQHLAAFSPAGHGRLAGLLGTNDPDALRHARRQPGLGLMNKRAVYVSCSRLGNGPRGHPEEVGQQVRRRKLPYQAEGQRPDRSRVALHVRCGPQYRESFERLYGTRRRA